MKNLHFLLLLLSAQLQSTNKQQYASQNTQGAIVSAKLKNRRKKGRVKHLSSLSSSENSLSLPRHNPQVFNQVRLAFFLARLHMLCLFGSTLPPSEFEFVSFF
ncbi:unnamed protein product [Vicia faba]|uniref:Secreted protein n=1 Tax=Vicia faba TaxID=3906 RepID=A0AAV1B5V5_VICFA|nr:unnamed protein product [Vicia faba]